MRLTRSLTFAAAAMIALASAAIAVPAAADGFCPPGLQKKGNGCLPPGQAKKQHWYGEPDQHRWREGDIIRSYPYVIIRDYGGYHLPPPPDGSVYVASGGQLLRVYPSTLEVIGIVGLVSQLLR